MYFLLPVIEKLEKFEMRKGSWRLFQLIYLWHLIEFHENWMNRSLNDRSQRTKIGSYFNDSTDILSGVPQFKTNIKYKNSKKSIFKFKLKSNFKNISNLKKFRKTYSLLQTIIK